MTTITREDLEARLVAAEPLTLVETLSKAHYDDGHLPGAIHVPHDEIAARAASALPDREATIVVYCASTECQNSRIAAAALRAEGYRNVLEYVEGKSDWEEAGNPLERETPAA